MVACALRGGITSSVATYANRELCGGACSGACSKRNRSTIDGVRSGPPGGLGNWWPSTGESLPGRVAEGGEGGGQLIPSKA